MFEVLSYTQGTALAVIGLIPIMFILVTKKNGLWLQALSFLAALASAFGWGNAVHAILLS